MTPNSTDTPFGPPDPTDAVEHAAKAIVREEGILEWDGLSERLRDHPRGLARAALTTALDAVDIAGILLTHDDMLWVPSGEMECPCGYRVPADNADVSTLRAHQVDAIRTAILGEA